MFDDMCSWIFEDLLTLISLGQFEPQKWQALICALESIGCLCRAGAVRRRYEHYSNVFGIG